MNRNYVRNYITLSESQVVLTTNSLNDYSSDYLLDGPTVNNKFEDVATMLYDIYSDWYIGYVDLPFRWGTTPLEPTEDDINKIKQKFVKNFLSVYLFTSDKYLVLLNYYEERKNSLLTKLNSTSNSTITHKVNDTPQNAGNFEGEDFTSIFEQTTNDTTKVDNPETIMTLLDEVQTKFRNIIGDWAKEFEHLFLAPYGM